MDFALPIAITPADKSPLGNFEPQKPAQGFFAHLLDHFIPHARNNYHPHIFSHRMTGLLTALLVTLKIFSIAAVAWGPVAPVFSEAITINNIISLTNQSRQEQSLGALTENQLLNSAAQSKANDMLAKGYFAHNSPDGKTPWDFITAAGYNYITAGENLAVNFTEAENVENAWMNSPGHRANILNSSYKEIGIGIAQGPYQGHEAIFVVQMFGTLANQKVTLNEEPTPVQKQAVAPPSKPVAEKVQITSQPVAQPASLPVQQPAVKLEQEQQPVELVIGSPEISLVGTNLVITATTSDSAVKVLASLGKKAVLLDPKGNDVWQGTLDISEVSDTSKTVILRAYDLLGNVKLTQVADVAGSTQQNFALSPEVKAAHVTIAGITFDPHVLENNFYLLFIAVMLLSLILAIGIKRHVQHLSLVMNGSLVIVLALILWMR